MSRLQTLTRMAFHEMWITFRLIVVVGLPILGGVVVIAIPPAIAGVTAVGGAGFWYAIGTSVAVSITAGLAAAAIANERRKGTVAWMAVRAVPRSAVLMSWFLAFGVLSAAGIAIGSGGAWLAAVTRAELPPDPLPFAAAIVAAAAWSLAAVAAGLLIGSLLGSLTATLVSAGLAAAVGAAAIALPLGRAPLPTGGIALLAHLDSASRPVAGAFQSGGLALAMAAGLLVLAAAALERSDL